jgi:CRP-like cAMP-binding protein
MHDDVKLKIDEFFSKYPLSPYDKNITILSAGENPKNVYYLKSGYVKMYSISESGKELTLNIFKPDTYFPGIWSIAQIPNYFFYETMVRSEISHIPNDSFLNFIKKEPEVLYDLTKRILSGLNGTLVRMDYLLSTNAHTRVSATLLMCSQRFGKQNSKGGIELQLPLTHKDIANLAGLSRESTSVELENMVRDGLIENKNRSFVIKNLAELRRNSLIYIEDTPQPYTF